MGCENPTGEPDLEWRPGAQWLEPPQHSWLPMGTPSLPTRIIMTGSARAPWLLGFPTSGQT